MNNVPKSIGWADYTLNPVTGRCKGAYEYHVERCDKIANLKKPSKIFVGSTHDLFGDWIPQAWVDSILFNCSNPQHTFFFLTKNPWRYSKFGFAQNQWAGVTHTGKPGGDCITDIMFYSEIVAGWKHQPHCFLSCEPLLGDTVDIPSKCEWIIIGAMTGHGRHYQPELEWITNLVWKATKKCIPIFMKSNLKKTWKNQLIQQFPKGVPT